MTTFTLATPLDPRAPPEASVVIPAFNRLDLLRPVLEGFGRLEARAPFELVLVDDGSAPPVASLLAGLPAWPGLRAVPHAVNQGRGAAVNTGVDAARGRVVIVVDSDIVPEPGFVDDHLAFHAAQPDPLATHLGRLDWGIEPGPLGDLLGPRSNPRVGAARRVGWTEWYTDNWSFKRGLFARPGIRFDPAYRAWGWEDLDLAWRLRALGATNDLGAAAAGRHLKAPTAASMTANFARSVPNLVRLTRQAGAEATRDWLVNRFEDPRLLAPAARLARRAVEHVESIWGAAKGAPAMPPRLLEELRIGTSDALFALGMAEGFAALPLAEQAGLPPRTVGDAHLLMRFVDLPAHALIASHVLGPAGRPDHVIAALNDFIREAPVTGDLAGQVGRHIDLLLEGLRARPR